MILKRLFNWIRFKSFTPSYSFRNRLYIERDSKHRRIMSNLGLVFRNSKWTDYSLNNISLRSRKLFFAKIRQSILVLIFCYFTYNYNYYFTPSIISDAIYTLWTVIEDTTTIFLLSVWVLVQAFVLLGNNFVNLFLFEGLKPAEENSDNGVDLDLNTILLDKSNKPTTSKNDKKALFQAWLMLQQEGKIDSTASVLHYINKQDAGKTGSLPLVNLFNNGVDTSKWLSDQKFIQSTFKLSDLALNSIRGVERVDLKQALNCSTKVKNSQSLNAKSKTTGLLDLSEVDLCTTLDTLIDKRSKVNFKTSKVNQLSDNFKWNSLYITQEIKSKNNLAVGKAGNYYLTNQSFFSLNGLMNQPSNALLVNDAVKDRIKSIKWGRWLYRYNGLHNKSLKNSHKITMSKKLVSSGFFSDDITAKNIWASNQLWHLNSKKPASNNGKLKALLRPSYKVLYDSFFFDEKVTTFNRNKLRVSSNYNNVSLLNHYESSFMWVLKRLYLTTTLPANNVSSLPAFLENIYGLNDKVEEQLRCSILYTMASSSLLTNEVNSLQLFDVYNVSGNANLHEDLILSNTLSGTKDVLIDNGDYDLLSADNLEILVNLTKSSKTPYNKSPLYVTSTTPKTYHFDSKLRTFNS